MGQATQDLALQALDNIDTVNAWIKETVAEREILVSALGTLPQILHIYPSDANFVLAKTIDAKGIYNHLVAAGIIVRDRSRVELCAGCLRITVGTPEENIALLETIKTFQ